MENIVLLNPIEQIRELFEFDGHKLKDNLVLSHIKYDPKLDNDFDYQIIRQRSHDGTLLFTRKVISEALTPLVNMETYCKKDLIEEETKNVESIIYTIGNVKLESEYDNVNSSAGEIPGVYKYSFNTCSMRV